MRINPKNLPLRDLTCLFWTLRRALFSRPKPDVESLIIPAYGATLPELKTTFGHRHFSNNVETSWYYRGEVLNMARADIGPTEAVHAALEAAGITPGVPWCQTHIRGWLLQDGTIELQPHFELAPTDYPRGHIEGVYFDRQTGIRNARAVLDEAGIECYRSPAGDQSLAEVQL